MQPALPAGFAAFVAEPRRGVKRFGAAALPG
jgi:hypothetical protein